MDKWELLAIRICKRNDKQYQMLRRLSARRCQISLKFVNDEYMALWLLDISEKFDNKQLSVKKLIREWSVVPHSVVPHSIIRHILNCVISHIALTKIKDIPEYKSKAFWRNKKKTITVIDQNTQI